VLALRLRLHTLLVGRAHEVPLARHAVAARLLGEARAAAGMPLSHTLLELRQASDVLANVGRRALREARLCNIDAILLAALAADVQAARSAATALGQAAHTTADLSLVLALRLRLHTLLVGRAHEVPLARHAFTARLLGKARAAASAPLRHALIRAPPIQKAVSLAMQGATTSIDQATVRTVPSTSISTSDQRKCEQSTQELHG